MAKIRIVSDGIAKNTRIFTESGEDISSNCLVPIIVKIENGLVTTTVTYRNVAVDLIAEEITDIEK